MRRNDSADIPPVDHRSLGARSKRVLAREQRRAHGGDGRDNGRGSSRLFTRKIGVGKESFVKGIRDPLGGCGISRVATLSKYRQSYRPV